MKHTIFIRHHHRLKWPWGGCWQWLWGDDTSPLWRLTFQFWSKFPYPHFIYCSSCVQKMFAIIFIMLHHFSSFLASCIWSSVSRCETFLAMTFPFYTLLVKILKIMVVNMFTSFEISCFSSVLFKSAYSNCWYLILHCWWPPIPSVTFLMLVQPAWKQDAPHDTMLQSIALFPWVSLKALWICWVFNTQILMYKHWLSLSTSFLQK